MVDLYNEGSGRMPRIIAFWLVQQVTWVGFVATAALLILAALAYREGRSATRPRQGQISVRHMHALLLATAAVFTFLVSYTLYWARTGDRVEIAVVVFACGLLAAAAWFTVRTTTGTVTRAAAYVALFVAMTLTADLFYYASDRPHLAGLITLINLGATLWCLAWLLRQDGIRRYADKHSFASPAASYSGLPGN